MQQPREETAKKSLNYMHAASQWKKAPAAGKPAPQSMGGCAVLVTDNGASIELAICKQCMHGFFVASSCQKWIQVK
jgi:hypothetical protein